MGKDNKKILFITSTFPDSNESVLAKWIGQLATNITENNYYLTVFAPASRGGKSHKYFNIDVVRFRYAPKRVEILTQEEGAVFKVKKNPLLLLLLPSFFVFGIANLVLHLIKEKYDVFHVHWPFPMGIFGVVAKIVNPTSKLVFTFYGAEFALVRKIPFGRKILRILIKRADSITSISNYTKGLVESVIKIPVAIIPFTTGFVAKTTTSKRKTKSKNNILFVGRLIERKGVEYLIQAGSILKDKTDILINIVGGGVLLEELKRKTREHDLESIVKFHGKVSDAKLISLYKESDIFVLPSIHDRWGDTEGLGVVLLEAMSFKKPVIASRVGGIVDIVKHGKTGILVPEKNPQKLADAIYELLSNELLYKKLSKDGFEYLNNNFSWESIIEKTKKIYEK